MNYRDIPTALCNREPFEANSMSAIVSGGTYIVKSYVTTIAEVDMNTGEKRFNDQKYSRTTSRHQSLVHAHL